MEPIRDDPSRSLRIITGAHVHRILFEGTRAVGVELQTEGGAVETMRGDEIILCAGAVHSPAILQRSGVGPAPLLASLGIEQVADLPVGENFQDHPGIRLNIPLKEDAQLPSGGFRHIGVVGRYTSGVPGTGLADMQIVGLNGGVAHDAVNAGDGAAAGFARGGIVIWLVSAASPFVASFEASKKPCGTERGLLDRPLRHRQRRPARRPDDR